MAYDFLMTTRATSVESKSALSGDQSLDKLCFARLGIC